MFKSNRIFTVAAVSAALFALTTASRAQLIYSQDFHTDDSANWVTNSSHTGSNYVNFNFDYSTIGIPPAPHSVGGNTKGLKMSPNVVAGPPIGSASVDGVSVSPTNFSISDNFVMHFDLWVNVNCKAYTSSNLALSAHNGSGSTVCYGAGYGTVGNSAQVAGTCDSIIVGTATDNGSSAQMRMYGPSVIGESSFQNGVFQSTGTTTPGFPGDPFVYNTTGGTRAFDTGGVGLPPWGTIFPSVLVPDAQTNLFPQQMWNASLPGLIDFKWHDVSVQKIGNVIVYSIDGNIVATGNYSAAGTPAGSLLVFTAFDTSASGGGASTDPNFVALNFGVFANILVSNYDNVVNVTAPTPTCTEGSPGSPGVFTLTRSSAGVPLTVNYTLTGTATNGVQYQTLPTTVTFSSTALSTNINVVPIDDGIPSLTTSVILTVQPGTGYAGAGSAVVSILDNDAVTVDISGGSQAYGRYTNTTGVGNNDFISYTVTRRGKLTTGADLSVNLSYGGSAVSGTDFTPVSSIPIPDGTATATLSISPVDNASVTTNRTVAISIASGTGYAVGAGPANGTVVSAHYDPAPVLLTDALTNSDGGTNWSLVYGSGDPNDDPADFSADFGMALDNAAGGVTIPPPPNGNANALHLTCNKLAGPSSPGAINAYYTNLFLSGNYAVRFNMNLIQGSVNPTEGAVFGINHTGTSSNWWFAGGFITNMNWASDGIWYFLDAQPGGTTFGDYQEFTGIGGTNANTGWQRLAALTQTNFATAFKDNPGPFTCFDGFGAQTPGVPANQTPGESYDASTWSDVEIKQQDNVVTLSINRTTIFVYTNTTVWTNGYLMLGYSDPFGATIGSADAGVYYANLQVVQLPSLIPPVYTINSLSINGANVVIKFTTTNPSDTQSSFSLTTSSTVGGPYSVVSSSIAPLGSNQFQATTPYVGGTQQFYRIMHN